MPYINYFVVVVLFEKSILLLLLLLLLLLSLFLPFMIRSILGGIFRRPPVKLVGQVATAIPYLFFHTITSHTHANRIIWAINSSKRLLSDRQNPSDITKAAATLPRCNLPPSLPSICALLTHS